MDYAKVAAMINESTITTFKERGRGKKQCPKCKVVIGVRNKVCICNHKFVKGGEAKIEVEDPDRAKALVFAAALDIHPYKGSYLTYTPAGKCPVKLGDDVVEWATEVMDIMYSDGHILTPGALKYWVGKFVDPNTEHCVELCSEIDSFVNEMIGT
jgi:hypothetical protein